MAKRIVINLEPGAKPVRRKSRRWLRVLTILALFVLGVVVVAALGIFFWWRHYQTTPAYSLTLLVDAAQRSDAQELARRIDDEEIARNMIANVTQKAIDRYGMAMSASTQQQIDKLMPSLLPRVKETIHDEVAKEVKSFAATSESKPFIFLLITVPSLVTITAEGDVAKAAAAASNRTIELTMRRDADRWKVIGFNDEVVVQRVVDSVMKELPAIGSIDPNSPLLKKPGRSRKRRR